MRLQKFCHGGVEETCQHRPSSQASAESTIHKILGKMEEMEQVPSDQALRGLGGPGEGQAFTRTYANVSRQVRNKLQDRR